jgi:CHAT domain-containing protein/Tfp pilus assembly protein PilF
MRSKYRTFTTSRLVSVWLQLSVLTFGPLFATMLATQLRAECTAEPSSSISHKPKEKTLGIIHVQPGKAVKQPLSTISKVRIAIELSAGQYLHLEAAPEGLQISIDVFDPQGQKVRTVATPYSSEGSVSVFLVASIEGTYRFDVSEEKDTGELTGFVTVRVVELRSSNAADRARSAGQAAFEQGESLHEQGTAESLKKALSELKAAEASWKAAGEQDGEAEALLIIGVVDYDLGENEQALEALNKAQALFHGIGDLRGEAASLDVTGEAEDAIGNENDALGHYSAALQMRQNVGDRLAQAETLNNLGVLYDSIGDEQKAIDYLTQSLSLKHELKLHQREAKTLNNLGWSYLAIGETQKALEYSSKAVPLMQALKDHNGEAAALRNMGSIYLTLGDARAGIDYYRRALQAAELAGNKVNRATILNNMGLAFFQEGKNEEALRYFRDSLALQRTNRNPGGEAAALSNIGRVYGRLGDTEHEVEQLIEALALVRAEGDRRWEALILNNLAAAYNDRSQYQEALSSYQQALSLAKQIGDIRSEAKSLSGLGQAQFHLGHFEEARTAAAASLPLVDSLRLKVASLSLRTSYFATLREPYDLYIDLLMQLHKQDPAQGYEREALEVVERSRARSLLEMLNESRTDIRTGVDQTLAERERSLQLLVDKKREAQITVRSGKHTVEQASEIGNELERATREYQEVEGEIRASSPKYASLTQPQPLTLQEIQHNLLDPDTMLLEYSVGDPRSYVWAVTADSLLAFELPSQKELEPPARRLHEALIARNKEISGESAPAKKQRLALAVHEYQAASRKLSQMVLAPLALLLGTKRLVIVADGALQYVPWEALSLPAPGENLSSGNPEVPLITEHEVLTLPSASVLAELRQSVVGRPTVPKQLAILADPVFDQEDVRVHRLANSSRDGRKTGRRPKAEPKSAFTPAMEKQHLRSSPDTADAAQLRFSRLAFTRREADEAMAFTMPGQALEALDFRANRTRAMSSDLAQFRIVHFATHGLLDTDHPELSGLVFSLVDEAGRPQNGFLELRNVYNLNLPIDLVVLSACQTGLGKEMKGEGLIGLTRGFMYAGSPRVIASLWRVDDEATADLMGRFYRSLLKDGLRPAAALRQAQIEMRKQKRWHDPYYWAAFTIQGEWR